MRFFIYFIAVLAFSACSNEPTTLDPVDTSTNDPCADTIDCKVFDDRFIAIEKATYNLDDKLNPAIELQILTNMHHAFEDPIGFRADKRALEMIEGDKSDLDFLITGGLLVCKNGVRLGRTSSKKEFIMSEDGNKQRFWISYKIYSPAGSPKDQKIEFPLTFPLLIFYPEAEKWAEPSSTTWNENIDLWEYFNLTINQIPKD